MKQMSPPKPSLDSRFHVSNTYANMLQKEQMQIQKFLGIRNIVKDKRQQNLLPQRSKPENSELYINKRDSLSKILNVDRHIKQLSPSIGNLRIGLPV